MRKNLKPKPSIMPLIRLLFVFNVEYSLGDEQEEIVVSKNVNLDSELSELFDIFLRPEFINCPGDVLEEYIGVISYYLDAGDSFDILFEKMETYFDQDIHDQRHFMEVLLRCLKCYQSEVSKNSTS